MGYIYIIINLVNWKVYIGKWKGINVEDRWEQHKRGNRGNQHLYKSINKYGVEYSYFGILHENVPYETLNDLEIEEIAKYNCNSCRGGWGYNKTDGGDGVLGWKASKEQRRKNSEAKMGKSLSEEHCRRISEGLKGRTYSDEHRRNLSEVLKGDKNHNYGKPLSEAHRQSISDALKGEKHPNYGKIASNETCRKLSKALKGKPKSNEHRRNISEGLKGKPLSEKRRRRIAEARRSPEYDEANEIFLSLPLEMHIKEKRKQLYAKFPEIKKGTIRYWVRQWLSAEAEHN